MQLKQDLKGDLCSHINIRKQQQKILKINNSNIQLQKPEKEQQSRHKESRRNKTIDTKIKVEIKGIDNFLKRINMILKIRRIFTAKSGKSWQVWQD